MYIKCRPGQAKRELMDMKNVLCTRKTRLNSRKRLLKCFTWSVLLYESEPWTISKAM